MLGTASKTDLARHANLTANTAGRSPPSRRFDMLLTRASINALPSLCQVTPLARAGSVAAGTVPALAARITR
jgi:hypothetical protein